MTAATRSTRHLRNANWIGSRSAAFKEGLDETIQWYIDNPSWWQPLLERTGRVLIKFSVYQTTDRTLAL